MENVSQWFLVTSGKCIKDLDTYMGHAIGKSTKIIFELFEFSD